MGLDLTVTLKKESEKINFMNHELANKEDISFEVDELSSDISRYLKYYRLNWHGVSVENKFSNYKLDFLKRTNQEKLEALITNKNIKKNKVYLITGYQYKKHYPEAVYFEEIVRGSFIKNTSKNLLKIKAGYLGVKDIYLHKFKIYEAKRVIQETYSSVLNLISFNFWTGSNGEVYVLKHTKNGIVVYDVSYDDNENMIETEKYILKDDSDFKQYLNKYIKALEDHLKSSKKDNHKYIAGNNLTISLMLKEFFEDEKAELISYFG